MKFLTLLILALTLTTSSVFASTDGGTPFQSLSCHEGLDEQCQGCEWYDIKKDQNTGIFSVISNGDAVQEVEFRHIRFRELATGDEITGYRFSGLPTKKMLSDFQIHGLSAVAASAIKFAFEVKVGAGGSFFGKLKYQVLGVTLHSDPIRCELNAK